MANVRYVYLTTIFLKNARRQSPVNPSKGEKVQESTSPDYVAMQHEHTSGSSPLSSGRWEVETLKRSH